MAGLIAKIRKWFGIGRRLNHSHAANGVGCSELALRKSSGRNPKGRQRAWRARRWSLGEQSSRAGSALSHRLNREESPVETSTDTLIERVDTTDILIERVDKLVQFSKAPLEWGNPLLSTTPTSLAVRELAARVEALADAVREIALEVQKLSAQD
jgi:hypothetical protein